MSSSVLVLPISAIEPYSGPYAIPGVRFRAAREALGVTAWGMNVLELDPGNAGHPEHDHTGDGQEEVYVVLEGGASLHTPDGVHTLVAGGLCRVAPEVRRKLIAGEHGARILAIGGTPGAAFTPTL
jgi:uncharacterized cupin superfamily protein